MENAFTKTSDEIIRELKTDRIKGLSKEEAAGRLAKSGPNSLGEEKKVPLWKRFLQQFCDAMIIILIAAAGLSAAFRRFRC